MTKKGSRITCFALAIIMAVSMMPTAFAASVTDFTDVSAGAWYYDAVEYAATNKLFEGTSGTTFSPNVTMSRGMFITVLGRLAGVPDYYGRTETTPYNDIDQSQYWFPYAAWGKDNNIIATVGSNLYPESNIFREEMAYMIYQYAIISGYDDLYSADRYNTFTDTSKVHGYAVTALQWATTHGIINGDAGIIDPQGISTRAQVAQVFLNFSKMEAQEPETPDWENYNPTYDVPAGKSAVDADGGYYDYDLANELMKQVNELRAENGLNALLYTPKIQGWASIRAKEQLSSEGHTRPDGSDCVSVGQGLTLENITIMRNCSNSELNDTDALAQRALSNWSNSSGHRRNMLSSASNLGAISCYVKNGSVHVVHLFSNRTLYFMDNLI